MVLAFTIFTLLLAVSSNVTAQIAQIAQQKSNSNNNASEYSISATIMGTHGFTLRGDCNISEFVNLNQNNSSTRVYIDASFSGKKFDDNANFKFSGTNYSSDVTIYNLGIGFAQEFLLANNKLTFSPFIGVRYESARFKDKSLVDAIGENGLIRYWGGVQVGPSVANAYGNATTIDLGVRLGYKLGKVVELTTNIGFSPIKYSTSETLFGEYWGEAPYSNKYYINRSNIRLEGGLRFNF